MGGKKTVRMVDVAAAAGVSQTAVSLALKNDPQISAPQRQRIQQLCRDMGYRLSPRRPTAAAGRRRGLARIAVAFVGQGPLRSPLLGTLSGQCLARGIRLEIISSPPGRTSEAAAQSLIAAAQGLDGLVLTDLVDLPLLRALRAGRRPYVVIGHIRPGLPERDSGELLCGVVCDETSMAREAVHALVAQGHRRIGFLGGRVVPGFYTARWLDGFRLAHADLGRPPGPVLVEEPGDTDERKEARMRGMIRPSERPTGYVSCSAEILRHFVRTAKHGGVSVAAGSVILGDQYEEAVRHEFTAWPLLVPDTERMVEVALDLLVRQLNGTPAMGEVIVPCRAFHFPPMPPGRGGVR